MATTVVCRLACRIRPVFPFGISLAGSPSELSDTFYLLHPNRQRSESSTQLACGSRKVVWGGWGGVRDAAESFRRCGASIVPHFARAIHARVPSLKPANPMRLSRAVGNAVIGKAIGPPLAYGLNLHLRSGIGSSLKTVAEVTRLQTNLEVPEFLRIPLPKNRPRTRGT